MVRVSNTLWDEPRNVRSTCSMYYSRARAPWRSRSGITGMKMKFAVLDHRTVRRSLPPRPSPSRLPSLRGCCSFRFAPKIRSAVTTGAAPVMSLSHSGHAARALAPLPENERTQDAGRLTASKTSVHGESEAARPLLKACPPRQRRAPPATSQTNPPPPDEPACHRRAARSRSTCYLSLTPAKRIRQSVEDAIDAGGHKPQPDFIGQHSIFNYQSKISSLDV